MTEDLEATLPSGTRELFRALTIVRVRVELELTAPARFHFVHGGALMGLLYRAWSDRHDLPSGVIPLACESGWVDYAAGDHYVFGLTLAGAATGALDRLVDGLTRLGEARPDPAVPPAPLGGNFRVSSNTIVARGSLRALVASPALLDGGGILELRSPLRVPLPKSRREPGQAFLGRGAFPLAPLLWSIWGRMHALVKGAHPTTGDREGAGLPSPNNLDGVPAHLHWLDVPIGAKVRSDTTRPTGYTKGGVVGRVLLEELPPAWRLVLQAATVLHAGEGPHLGFGEVGVGPLGGPLTPRWCSRSRPLIERCVDDALIARALVERSSSQLETTPDGDPVDLDTQVAGVVGRLRRGTYRAPVSLGWLKEKRSGGVRPLAAPPPAERVVQRATCQALMPVVDRLLEESSFAYRKGYSVQGAVRAVERAWRDGYRWVLDADISAFFDHVDHDLLIGKLRALWPDERLVNEIEGWLRAPVRFEGVTVAPQRGLPQGLPLSPLLANLYLDALDERVLAADVRLVRYADDFLVLCRDPEAVAEARAVVESALADLGLKLHQEKTRHTSFDAGFAFLGHLFCRSFVIPAPGARADDLDARPLVGQELPPGSWLALVREGQARRWENPTRRRLAATGGATAEPAAGASGADAAGLTPGRALVTARSRRAPRIVSLEALDAHERRLGRPFYVLTPGAQVRLRQETLEVVRESGEVHAVPVRALSHAVIGDRVRLTTPALMGLARAGCPVFLVTAQGALRAMVGQPPVWPIWSAQARAAADPGLRLTFSRLVVASKLGASRALLERWGVEDAVRGPLVTLAGDALRESDPDTLRGLEGAGARVVFRALGGQLSPDWGFAGRARRPPPDPVNAMLSYGYTVLHHCATTALVAAGCDPRIGLWHVPRAGHAALASDLQEEWRWVVDEVTVSFAKARAPGDGFATTVAQGCRMEAGTRLAFTRALLQALCEEGPSTTRGSTSLLERLGLQAIRLREWLTGHADGYVPATEAVTPGREEDGDWGFGH